MSMKKQNQQGEMQGVMPEIHPTTMDKLSDEQFEGVLQSTFHRFECPTPDDLRDYAWEILSAQKTSFVANHLTHCVSCTQELSEVAAVITPVESPSLVSTLQEMAGKLQQQTKVVIAKLMDDMNQGLDSMSDAVADALSPNTLSPNTMQPAFGALRSGSAMSNSIYEAGDTMIDLRVRPDKATRLMVAGQLLLPEVGDASDIGTFRLSPQSANTTSTHYEQWQENEHILNGVIDENGSFQATHVQPGRYQLTLQTPETTYVIPDLTLQLM
ncbi:MAG: hypothetical protein AAF639_30790 [Chloroflexota bacterium]